MDLGSATIIDPMVSSTGSPEGKPVELADIFRSLGREFLSENNLTPRQEQAFRNIVECRTGAKGGHIWRCGACAKSVHQYNSCLDRHCPKC